MPFSIYIIVMITFISLGIVCFFMKIKEGVLASGIASILTIICFILHYIFFLTNSFFEKTGLTFKDIVNYAICIAVAILAFLLIIFFIKFFGIKKR